LRFKCTSGPLDSAEATVLRTVTRRATEAAASEEGQAKKQDTAMRKLREGEVAEREAEAKRSCRVQCRRCVTAEGAE
jgi:hypothetical protein